MCENHPASDCLQIQATHCFRGLNQAYGVWCNKLFLFYYFFMVLFLIRSDSRIWSPIHLCMLYNVVYLFIMVKRKGENWRICEVCLSLALFFIQCKFVGLVIDGWTEGRTDRYVDYFISPWLEIAVLQEEFAYVTKHTGKNLYRPIDCKWKKIRAR